VIRISHWVSVFDNILAVARGMTPDKNRVLDSEVIVTIVQYSHFLPDERWELPHSKTVHMQFGELFAL